jgi:hypothetical protein
MIVSMFLVIFKQETERREITMRINTKYKQDVIVIHCVVIHLAFKVVTLQFILINNKSEVCWIYKRIYLILMKHSHA